MNAPAPSRGWRAVAVAALPVILLTVLALMTMDVSDPDYPATLDVLRQSKQLDARCEAQVLRARLGLDGNYDALSRTLADIDRLGNDLESRLGRQPSPEARGLVALARAQRLGEARKAALVERFKSENSILRNSLAFLPVALSDLEMQIGVSHASAPMHPIGAHAQKVLLTSLTNAQSAAPEDAEEVARETDWLLAARGRANTEVAQRLDIFVTHARTVAREQSVVTGLVRRIASAQSESRLDDIEDRLARNDRAADERLEANRRYLLIFAAAALILFLGVAARLAASQAATARANHALAQANATLEQRIEARTADLRQAQQEVIATARKAGMAEIATNVLHNVGNVLNGVNVSAATIAERLRGSRLRGLSAAMGLMAAHSEDLCAYLSSDVQGRLLPAYLAGAVEALELEHRALLDESTSLTRSVDHLKDIVASQQDHARAIRLVGPERVDVLVDESLRMHADLLVRLGVHVDKAYGATGPLVLDRVRILQILGNLIRNAAQAMSACQFGERHLHVGIERDVAGSLRISVADSGAGISAENLTRIFGHGFSTRPGGHGFGLHSAALAAREMGGTLRVHSDGDGRGARFTLELEARPVEPSS